MKAPAKAKVTKGTEERGEAEKGKKGRWKSGIFLFRVGGVGVWDFQINLWMMMMMMMMMIFKLFQYGECRPGSMGT